MSGKIVNDGEMVFLDDITFFEEEISQPFNIPDVPIFSRDELMLFYHGQVYVTQDSTAEAGDRIKVYTQSYILKKTVSPKKQEMAWFTEHNALIAQLQKEFIGRCVGGINIDNGLEGVLGHQISAELLERIEQSYAGTDKDKLKVVQAINQNTSVFNTLPASRQSLALDGKVYALITVGEYLRGFEKAFEPDFFQKMVELSGTKSPKEIAQELNAHQDKLSPRALFFIRDKIWNGDRSFEINIDGDYLVPQFTGEVQPVITEYLSRLREKIKYDAAKAYK